MRHPYQADWNGHTKVHPSKLWPHITHERRTVREIAEDMGFSVIADRNRVRNVLNALAARGEIRRDRPNGFDGHSFLYSLLDEAPDRT